MNSWLVCAGENEGLEIKRYLLKSGVRYPVACLLDAREARQKLIDEPLSYGVVAGEGLRGPHVVNAAAAFAHDAAAAEVVLVVRDASGSLRSRAKRAGITRVITFDELALAPAGHTQFESSAVSEKAAAHETSNAEIEPASPAVEDAPEVREESLGSPVSGEVAEETGPQEGEIAAEAYIQASEVSRGIKDSTTCSLEEQPKRKEGVPVITFVSGRGGVGKTTLCALAGYAAASWGMRVALLDLDLAFGNLAAFCGVEHPSDLASYVAKENPKSRDGGEGRESGGRAESGGRSNNGENGESGEHSESGMHGEVVEHSESGERAEHGYSLPKAAKASKNLDVFGPCRAPEYAELVQPYVAQLIATLTHAYDIVLVDTTTNWGDAVAAAAQEADRVAIVSDERPGAIAALTRCGGLVVRLGVARTRIVRVMNGCDPKHRDDAFVMRAVQGLDCSREIRVFDGGIEAQEFLACGRVSELMLVNNPLTSSISTGLAKMLQELGKLPPNEEATSALIDRRRTRRFFSRPRKAARV